MKFSWASCLICILTVFCAALAKADAPSSVVLYIFVEDGQAFTKEGRELMLEFLHQSIPGQRIALVKATSPRFFPQGAKIHGELLAQLQTALAPHETVSHLIIATHGSTTGRGMESQTQLQSIGKFNALGVDGPLAAMLAPLRGKIEKDARVVLDSCSTMCGTDKEAAARAQAFMKEIGATEGSLYGATNNEVDVRKLGADARTWAKLKPRWNLLRNVMLTSFALGIPVAWFGVGGESFSANPYVGHLQVMAYSGALMMAMFQYMEPAMIFLYEKMKSINEGRLFVFSRGQVQRSVEMSKRIESLSRIYHARSCTRLFLD